MTALLVSLLCASGCAPPSASAESEGPRVLRLAYLPSDDDPEGRMEALDLLATHIQEYAGLPVEITRAVSYAPTIEAMRAGKVDVMRSGGSFTYMIAHEKAGAEAIVAFGTSEGPGLYQSIIVAHPGSGLRTLEDLVARSAEIDFAFVDPASTSGHLIPRAVIENAGIVPEESFAQLVYTMSHTNSAMTILSGKVDAGAISKNTWDRLVENGRVSSDDLRILWRSDPMPTGPIIVRGDLPAELKAAIQAAYLAIDDEREKPLYRAMQATYTEEDLRLYPITDSHWDGLRSIARNVETMTMLPEG